MICRASSSTRTCDLTSIGIFLAAPCDVPSIILWPGPNTRDVLRGDRRHTLLLPRGRVVQVDPIKPKLKAPATKRLKLECDKQLSSFAFKFNLHCYPVADSRFGAAACVPSNRPGTAGSNRGVVCSLHSVLGLVSKLWRSTNQERPKC